MKRIAVFCDGTWNKMSSEHPTNVLMGAQAALHEGEDTIRQITFYDEGVGTSYNVSKTVETLLAGAFGWGLLSKIEAAYRFLIFNYEPGDEIYIFGFSRGAFTARSLAGLIRKCGIVPRSQARNIRKIFEFYKDAGTKPDSDAAQHFRMTFSPSTVLKDKDRDWRVAHGADPAVVASLPLLTIKYLGVWDTVGALGVPRHLGISHLLGTAKYEFHDAALSSTVKSARHAVAVDERKLSFKPTLWDNIDELNEGYGDGTNYQQVWFPGDHGSVGGGGDIQGLSSAAFLWIMEGAQKQGLAIDEAWLIEASKSIDHLAPLRNSSRPPGWLDRISRVGDREGPQQASFLAETTRLRLAHEVKGEGWAPYRPKTLERIWHVTR